MDYLDFIKGKRVIFVGACPNIKGLGKGPEIDDYDVVIKTNGSILLQDDEYHADYGRRCDVLYTNNQFQRETRPLPVEAWKARGLKHLCMKTVSEDDKRKYDRHVDVRTFRRLIHNVNMTIGTPYMGVYIYSDILRFEPAEFFITGVDFFASKKQVFEHDNYGEYIKGYLPDNIRHQGNKINKGKTKDGHHFMDNARFIYGLFNTHKNFKTDPFIYELLDDIVKGKVHQS